MKIGCRMQVLMAGLRNSDKGAFSYRGHSMFMQPGFERPNFYKELFKSWGLE